MRKMSKDEILEELNQRWSDSGDEFFGIVIEFIRSNEPVVSLDALFEENPYAIIDMANSLEKSLKSIG